MKYTDSNIFSIKINRETATTELGENGRVQSTIVIYKGNAKLTPVSSTPTEGEFKVTIKETKGCSASIKDLDTVYATELTSKEGIITLNIDVEGKANFVKNINLIKSLDIEEIENVETRIKIAEQKITNDSIANIVKEEFYTKGEVNTRMSSVEQTIDTWGVKIIENENEISSLKLTSEEFEVTIGNKADTSNIISMINASTEGITISSSKVNITGFVTFSDLSTSGSTTIHGGNITTGYMSGNRIKGGTISATDEINFVGGARIFGNTGGLDAGLTISAAGFDFSGGSVNHLSGNWYVTHGGDLTVSDGDISATNGNITAGGTITAGSAIYGAGNTALTNSYIWCPYGSSNRDYVRLGGHVIASDSDGTGYLLVLDKNGNYASLRAHAGSFANDVACTDVYASNKVYAGGVALTSDESLKTDIRYVGLDPQGISNNGLMAPNVNITTQDMHNFIETLPMVSYRMKQDVSKDVDYTYYGFVAQDILYTKVGSELIENGTITETEEILDKKGNVSEVTTKRDILRYSENKFTAFICGALQEEIKQRKALERRLNDLMDAINK